MAYHGAMAVFKREIRGYFFSGTAFVYTTLFLFTAAVFTFYVGDLIERNVADLTPFFAFHPYIFLMFIPALAMRLWSDERKSGTVELLLTLPITTRSLVLGKFLASWAFAGLALLGTVPIWLTVSFLGDPDTSVIIFAYIGSFLTAGGFLAICGYVSACTRNQVIAFIAGAVICFLFLMTGLPVILEPAGDILPPYIVDLTGHFSALSHFENFMKGSVSLAGFIYFGSLIVFWLYLTELRIHRLREGS